MVRTRPLRRVRTLSDTSYTASRQFAVATHLFTDCVGAQS
jgi:hypothetical protein